ncbi:MAG: hypothetical protein NZ601_02525 [candidate division WOR-3 bacterium]|nr:hypothetical protein [candidate division WOR-3 bacterium]MDW7987425.1 hypothetical protein [candidate division WOR-3 bacterium]
MLKKLTVVSVILITLGFIYWGCSTQSEEEAIRELLEESNYTAEGSMVVDDTGDISFLNAEFTDSLIPWVKWIRKVKRPVERNVNINIYGDSAVATITMYLEGLPPDYGFWVRNVPQSSVVYRRAITDSSVRQVKLVRIRPRHWRIVAVTPAVIHTVNAYTGMSINEVRLEVPRRNYLFVLNNPTRFLKRESLPDLRPDDTVKVTVNINVEDDSGWVFLHRARRAIGAGQRRMALFKRDQNMFVGTWIIPDEYDSRPTVRHCAFDLIGFESLFGDSTATYASYLWIVPYIIRNPSDEIPE